MSIYFTVTGTEYYYGTSFIQPGMYVLLLKDWGNRYDSEAIAVEMPGLGKVGYVANSPKTVIGRSYSAGRLYDRIGDGAVGEVLYVLPGGVLCSVRNFDLEKPWDEEGREILDEDNEGISFEEMSGNDSFGGL